MDPSRLRELLNELHFSADLPAAALDRLAEIGDMHEFRAGALLFREGSEHQQFYFLAKGHVALDMHVPSRGDVRILVLGSGDMVAWSALIGSGRMTTSALALDDVQAFVADADRLNDLCQQDHDFGYAWMFAVASALSRRLLATRLQLLDLFAEAEPHRETA